MPGGPQSCPLGNFPSSLGATSPLCLSLLDLLALLVSVGCFSEYNCQACHEGVQLQGGHRQRPELEKQERVIIVNEHNPSDQAITGAGHM